MHGLADIVRMNDEAAAKELARGDWNLILWRRFPEGKVPPGEAPHAPLPSNVIPFPARQR